MPYVRQRTWIQRAPRLRLGMGVANCPSMQQLMGITDPSDPCQGGGDYQTITTPAGDYQLVGGVLFDPTGKAVGGPSNLVKATGALDPVSNFIQQYKTPLTIGGIGLGVLMLIKAMR